jgi:hypothetical protein
MDALIDNYCTKVLGDEQALLLDDICRTTLEKYGPSQVSYALRSFIQNGDASSFSRYRGNNTIINYRNKMKTFPRNIVLSIIGRALDNRGVDPNYRRDAIESYVNTLSEEYYMDRPIAM